MSIRRSFRNLPVDRKFALVFAIALVVMLAVSLLVSSLTLGSYDRRLYSYEQGRLNSVMEMIVSRVDEIDSLSYSVAMDASLQDQLNALQDASTTLYRYGMMDVYSQQEDGTYSSQGTIPLYRYSGSNSTFYLTAENDALSQADYSYYAEADADDDMTYSIYFYLAVNLVPGSGAGFNNIYWSSLSYDSVDA